eukprot:341054_1
MSASSDMNDPFVQKVMCGSCLFSLSIIAAIPVGIGLLGNTREILDDEEFQLNCIDPYDDAISMPPPNDLEFEVLNGCTTAMIIAFICGCCAAFGKSDGSSALSSCSGCVLMISAFASVSLFLHIFLYVNQLNEAFEESSPMNCYIDDEWEVAYDWSYAGAWVGACVFGLCCCIFYMVGSGAKNSADNDTKPTPQPTRHIAMPIANTPAKPTPSNNDTRTVAIRGTTEEQRTLVGGLISLEVIDKLGFSIANNVNKLILLTVLKEVIKPEGQTALRDAIALSILKMISLKSILNEIGVLGHKFIHIVLTDGEDNKSGCSVNDIRNFYQKIGSSIGDTYFKTYFVGIDLGYEARRDLQSIADLAGDAAELFNCDDAKLTDIFSEITLSLGIRRRVALITDGTNIAGVSSETYYLKAQREKFLVLFDLDMSGSMSGRRWNSLLRALESFFDGLDDSDIIGCVLFNHQAQCITGEVLRNIHQTIINQ